MTTLMIGSSNWQDLGQRTYFLSLQLVGGSTSWLVVPKIGIDANSLGIKIFSRSHYGKLAFFSNVF